MNIDYHVEVERHYYSVPYQLARSRVEVRITAATIEVYARGRRIAASHLRSLRPGRHTTDAAHMPSAHRRYAEWSPARLVRWAEQVGPASGALVTAILESRPVPEQGFRSALGIMRLSRQYGPEHSSRPPRGGRWRCVRSATAAWNRSEEAASIVAHYPRAPPERRPPQHENIAAPPTTTDPRKKETPPHAHQPDPGEAQGAQPDRHHGGRLRRAARGGPTTPSSPSRSASACSSTARRPIATTAAWSAT